MDASAAGNYMAATSGFAIFFLKTKNKKIRHRSLRLQKYCGAEKRFIFKKNSSPSRLKQDIGVLRESGSYGVRKEEKNPPEKSACYCAQQQQPPAYPPATEVQQRFSKLNLLV